MTSAAPRDALDAGADPAPTGSVCAVVVTYRPNLALLRRVLAAVVNQVGGLVVVDNGTSCEAFDAFAAQAAASGCIVERKPANVGLAAGLNAGIACARRAGFGEVLLLDQDSVAAPGMVATLVRALEALSRDGRVGAVGTQFVDPRNAVVAPFVRIGFPFNRKVLGGPGQRIESDFLISSGKLLPLAVLDEVGGMDESLFIDNVDLDWCFRARRLGYRLYGVCDARMEHSIGDALRPSRWRRRGVFIHSPARLYYLTRNRLLLYRRAHTPRIWIAQDVPRLLGKFLRMSLLVAPRWQNARAMARGIRDGLLGRSGPQP
jgi:rhamnosyltransferase